MSPIVANFHGIGEPPVEVRAGELPFWLTLAQFSETITRLADSGRPYRVTFDDGNVSDLTVGAPSCARNGIEVTIFACSGRVGQFGYLDQAALREIAVMPGCTIGSHGRMHVSWRGLNNAALANEIEVSRAELEQLTDQTVSAAGLPFGAYDRRVLRALAVAGYETVYSSDGGPRLSTKGAQPRLALRGDQPIADQIDALIAGATPVRAAWQEARIQAKSWRSG